MKSRDGIKHMAMQQSNGSDREHEETPIRV